MNNEKDIVWGKPFNEAVTAYIPVTPFAENTGEVATPLAFVTAVATLVWVPPNFPLAPVAGAVKVTV